MEFNLICYNIGTILCKIKRTQIFKLNTIKLIPVAFWGKELPALFIKVFLPFISALNLQNNHPVAVKAI